MAENFSLKAIITGRVQGVSFREFTRRRAQALGLTGYVQNLPGGGVEVSAEGERSSLEALLKSLKQGPPHAIVERVAHQWGAAKGGDREFKVLY